MKLIARTCRFLIPASLLLAAMTTQAIAGSDHADHKTPDQLAEQIESASDAAAHEALAAHFRAEAAENAERATEHEKMMKRLSRTGAKQNTSWDTHCKRLISSYRAAEAEARGLAEVHEKLAKEASK